MKIDLKEIAGLYGRGKVLGEDLPDLAREAIGSGISSPSLSELADQDTGLNCDLPMNRELFNNALEELGIPHPTAEEEVWSCVRHVCRQILEGKVEFMRGAHEVSLLSLDLDDPSAGPCRVKDILQENEQIARYLEDDSDLAKECKLAYDKNVELLREEIRQLAELSVPRL